ncbi:DUF4130 domain-containing protein [Candidatus Micrarchaeota archaeon]|nr:DUF4130 domain-containing protein [Candidatus Micrarchaeota archaeon]
MDILYYLKMHNDCDSKILGYAAKLNPMQIDSSTDEKGVRVRKMARAVMCEIHQLSAFIRLQSTDNILHGYARPEHNIGLVLAAKLARRIPGKLVIIGNEEESYLAIVDKGKARGKISGPYPEILSLHHAKSEKDWVSDLWEEYYWTQYIESRKNERLFRKWVPEKFQEKARNWMGRKKPECLLTNFF